MTRRHEPTGRHDGTTTNGTTTDEDDDDDSDNAVVAVGDGEG